MRNLETLYYFVGVAAVAAAFGCAALLAQLGQARKLEAEASKIQAEIRKLEIELGALPPEAPAE